MIRLTLILAMVLFGAMLMLPGGETGDAAAVDADASDRPARAELTDEALVETADGGLVLVTPEGEELPIALVIEPSSLTAEDAEVNLPPAESSGALEPVLSEATEEETPTEDTTQQTAEAPAPLPDTGGARLRVTGDRVNFRAGPSTGDEILAALTFGTEVELIERVADGWAHLLVPETGLSGYMSEDFLEPAN